MGEKQKTLMCGDVNGNFNQLFSRVESIDKKSGPFEVLLCVGNFFGEDNSQLDAYKMGTRKVPVATYVFGPTDPKHLAKYCEEGSEIVPNVVYMGKRGIFTTSSDIKIAYLSGLSRRELGKDMPCTFEPSDCSAVRDACFRAQSEYRGVDILITSLWPNGVQKDDIQQVDVPQESLSDLIAWLSMHIKPRYHFVPSKDKYFERQPYRNLSVHQDYRELATRFLALAPVGNKAKEKWIYACSLQPISKMRMTELLQATTDETGCPYEPELLRQHQPGKVVKVSGNGQFFFNMDAGDDSQGGKKRRNQGDDPERKRIDFNPDECWFCLSSPTVERHLVLSVGRACYLALPKGPLAPYHVLILPITHHQSVTKAPDEVIEEIKRFKEALKQLYKSIGMLGVFFERNYKTSHLQVQAVPVPRACQGQLLEIFQDEAGLHKLQLERLPAGAEVAQAALPGAPYFHAELPGGEQLFARARPGFPLQFGRDVLSSTPILDCEDKADWRQCQLPKEDEILLVSKFRAKFKPFDFTAEEASDSD